jgi:L-seryl-tRNA(Ser) seleniumtransferase
MAAHTEKKSDLFQLLPSVDELMRTSPVSGLAAHEGRQLVTDAARAVLEQLRSAIRRGELDPASVEKAVQDLPARVENELRRQLTLSLRSVINATGVILHTNLGRAPLSADALVNIQRLAGTYSNLEFDLDSGERGKRDIHVDHLFRRLLGGDAADSGRSEVATLVVNNNAAAVWLSLNTLAAGGEVIVSRGELVEIGGSFRIPDVMVQSNGVLHEVGTTNRTRISDYANAINAQTRALLRVHRSNFEITGFTEQPALSELVTLARERALPLIEDLGSGALFDLSLAGVRGEEGVLDSLSAGVDVVTYSGDKLLGGPQAGILSGRPDLISRMRSNSLFRALRVDKLTYAALEATLLAYLKRDYSSIPALRMVQQTKSEVQERAGRMAEDLVRRGMKAEVVDGESVIGGGAAPSAALPTALLAIDIAHRSADELLACLRAADPPIIARVESDRVLLDLRTVFPEQDASVVAALRVLLSV